MFTAVAVLHRRLSLNRMLLHWFLCFWGNLAGALFVTIILFGYGGTFDADPYLTEARSYATKKQITPQFHQIFLRGIGCNWLVCLACFFAVQGKDLSSKIMGIWWPIFAFVSLGLDHVVANMFFIPMGIWQHTPKLTVGLYIWKGIIPAGLGNIIGGALFCGGYYWWMYLFQEPPVRVDGLTYEPYEEVKGVTLHFKRPHRDAEAGVNGKALSQEEVRGPEGTVLGGRD
jgi:formate/nitrite transporter